MLLECLQFLSGLVLHFLQLLLEVQLQIEQFLHDLVVKVLELFVRDVVDAVDLVRIVRVELDAGVVFLVRLLLDNTVSLF